jgi:hypothetical protein
MNRKRSTALHNSTQVARLRVGLICSIIVSISLAAILSAGAITTAAFGKDTTTIITLLWSALAAGLGFIAILRKR